MPKQILDKNTLTKLAKKLGMPQKYVREQISKRSQRRNVGSPAFLLYWAQTERLSIGKALRKADIETKQEMRSLGQEASPRRQRGNRRSVSGAAMRGQLIEIRFPKEFRAKDPILPMKKLQEARDMAALYPLIYVLENSIREVVRRVLRKKHGASWWEKTMDSRKLGEIKKQVAKRMLEENQKKWHQRRGQDPLDYV